MSRRFRSGTGGTYSGSTWEDWDGISPNGRQYRNAITQETRNLSGAEYWVARKSDYPSQYPETWKDGKANIEAFKEEPAKKGRQKKEIPLEYRLFPQQRRFDNLEALIKEVEDKYLDGQMNDEEFSLAMDNLEVKLERAWYLLCKAKGWTDELEEYEIKKDIARLEKQIERQKEKNERIYQQQALRQRSGRQRQPRGRQGSSWGWAIIAIGAFIIFF